MARTELVFYKEDDDSVPVLDWLKDLKKQNRRGLAKCVVRLRRLAELGHDLRRPEADFLRDDIYELRAKHRHVQYRILYFFHGQKNAVLAHAMTKRDKILDADINRAVRRRNSFRADPERRSYRGDLERDED